MNTEIGLQILSSVVFDEFWDATSNLIAAVDLIDCLIPLFSTELGHFVCNSSLSSQIALFHPFIFDGIVVLQINFNGD